MCKEICEVIMPILNKRIEQSEHYIFKRLRSHLTNLEDPLTAYKFESDDFVTKSPKLYKLLFCKSIFRNIHI